MTKTEDTYDGICDIDCSLRDAIGAARNGDAVAVPAGTYTLTQDELVIGKDLTLTGSGADSTIIQAADVLGGVTYRVLHITSGPDGPSPVVAISGVTIRHGRKSGIYNYRGILTLLGVVVTANEHNGYGGGIANEGSLTFIYSSVIGNRNTHQGGGISN